MYSFRFDTSSVWQRLALNLIEFIQSKVRRSFDSLAVAKFCKQLDNNDIGRALQNAAAFVFKCLAVNPVFGQESSSKLNVPINHLTVI